jgi:hypothetical protein
MRCSRVASGSTDFEHDKARNGNKLFPLMFSEVVETGEYYSAMKLRASGTTDVHE